MHLPQPSQGQYEPPPQGTHPARCYRFIDMGTQPKTFQGATKLVRLVRLAWELPNELMEKGENAGKPFSISNSYTWSMHEKAALRQMLESWRGKKFADTDFGPEGFNTFKLLGASCMINIMYAEKNGKTYTNVASVSPLIKGYTMPPAVNPTLYFSFDELTAIAVESERRKHFEEFATKVTPKMAEAIRNSPEFKKAFGIAESDHHEDESFGHASQALPDSAFEDTPF